VGGVIGVSRPILLAADDAVEAIGDSRNCVATGVLASTTSGAGAAALSSRAPQ
jgi:hypothetical protein